MLDSTEHFNNIAKTIKVIMKLNMQMYLSLTWVKNI